MPVHYLAQQGLRPGERRHAAPVRQRRRQARRYRPQRTRRRWPRSSTGAPTPPPWAPRRGTSSCGRARSRPGELAPFWTSPPYSHCNFTAMPSLDAGRRRRMGRRTCARWTGRTRSTGASSSSKGCTNGSVRTSTATRTCSPPWTNRGSRLDGERAGARTSEPRRPGTTAKPSSSPVGSCSRSTCACPTSSPGRSWSCRAPTPRSPTSSRPGAAARVTSWWRASPTATRARVPDPPAATARALMFADLPDWGLRAPIRTDGDGFDTTRLARWASAALIPERRRPRDRVLAAGRRGGGGRAARSRSP